MFARGVQPMFDPGRPGMKSPIASLADRSRSHAVDDWCAVDVGDDATLLDAVEERRKPWFRAPRNAARDERSAL